VRFFRKKDVVLDSVVIVNPRVHANEWRDFYVNAVKTLKHLALPK